MQPTVAVFGTLRFPPDRVVAVRTRLRKLVEATYQNDGCIAYDVAEDPFDLGSSAFPSYGQIVKVLRVTLRLRTSNLGARSHVATV